MLGGASAVDKKGQRSIYCGTEREVIQKHKTPHLKLELVGKLTLLEGEAAAEVCGEQGLLLDNLEERLVSLLLVGLARVGNNLLLLGLLEELASRLLLLVLLGPAEVVVGELLVHLDSADVNLGRGRNDKRLVHTAKGNTVDLEGAVDKEEAGRELLKEHDAASTEAAGEENEDRSGGDRRPELGRRDILAVGEGLRHVVSLVETGLADEDNLALATVLGTLDLLGLGERGSNRRLGNGSRLLLLVEGALLVHGRAAQAGDAIAQGLVAGVVGARRLLRGGLRGHCECSQERMAHTQKGNQM
eukprot:Opistho-2@57355